MIDQGVWIIVMLLEIGKHDVIIKQLNEKQYHNYQICMLDKSEEELKQKIPMACIKQGEV